MAVNRACLRDRRQLLSTKRHPNALVNRKKWHSGAQGYITQWLLSLTSLVLHLIEHQLHFHVLLLTPKPTKSTPGHGAAT